MNKVKVLKKVASLILTLCLILSTCALASVRASAAGLQQEVWGTVSFYSADTSFVKYGKSSTHIYIKTTGNGWRENVYVHYDYGDGSKEWYDEPATLVKSYNGYKIWEANISSYGKKFCLKYVANGKVFWDNNNGKNYTTEKIGKDTMIAASRADSYVPANKFMVVATLQNANYTKVVKVKETLIKSSAEVAPSDF